MKITKKILVSLIIAFLVVPFYSIMANDNPSYKETWDGKKGLNSENCALAGNDNRPLTGWIHWVFSTKGNSTSAALVLDGNGNGTYAPGDPLTANVWHFYTPYFDLSGLTATINLYGGQPGPGAGLVVSDYCPEVPYEELTVSKTVETSYKRTHNWSIKKSVDPKEIWLYTNGSGDQIATWTIDVAYEGYEDSDFNVSGTITIENTGTMGAMITAIDDVLAGTKINIDCGCINFPYTLIIGETLTCTYSEDVNDKIEGKNVVTVKTNANGEYTAEEKIVWGDPTTEVNKEVTVKDISDIFGEVELGKATAPNSSQFTYNKEFKWSDYGQEKCGSYQYKNTATIVETSQSALATLKVNVQCYVYKYESAFAKANGNATCFIPDFKRWGWTNQIYVNNGDNGSYGLTLYAGAAKCDTSKAINVGTVTVTYPYNSGGINAEFNLNPNIDLKEYHIYAGSNKYPQIKQGKKTVFTVAPGQYYISSGLNENIFVIIHAVVGIGYPNPEFGPPSS